MLVKLFLYDLKSTLRNFLTLFLVLLLSAISVNVLGTSELAGVLILFYVLLATFTWLVVIVLIFSYFKQSMFGKSAYFTHTLPASLKQILLSKYLISVFWMTITFFVWVLSMYFANPVFFDLTRIFKELGIYTYEIFQSLISILLFSLLIIVIYFTVLSFTHTYTNFKCRTFFVIVIVYAILYVYGTFIEYLTGLLEIEMNLSKSGLFSCLNLVNMAIIIGVYFINAYLLDKKVEIE